jgi:hypothetical protein
VKLRIFFVALAISASPASSLAQTPNMDREKEAIYAYLYKQGMNLAPTDIYIMATAYLKNDMCGEGKMPRSTSMRSCRSTANPGRCPRKF